MTTNVFGDILSDVSAMITGGIGMLPSACIGGPVFIGKKIHTYKLPLNKTYYYLICMYTCLIFMHYLIKGPQLFEPVHGSAPDIEGEVTLN